jgi:hypothetical protein
MKHIEYINGIADMIISDYKHNVRSFDIKLNKVSYLRPTDEWTCEIWYAGIDDDQWLQEKVTFTTGTPLVEISKLVFDTLDSIVL